VSVGNDVVDLEDPEARLDRLHPRWVDRVFVGAERTALERAGDARVPGSGGATSERHRLHWALWAAKESAYKARSRTDASTIFSPREFVVHLQSLPTADGLAVGRVFHRRESFAVEVRLEGAWLHAVATGADSGKAAVLTRVAFAEADPGTDVRRLAAAEIGSALALDPERLRIVGRPPVIRHDGRPLDSSVSLSHHGRFVAFACVTPRS
jgi:phosphopantetheinyl transferase (holo-ACP synthase)